MTNSAMPESIMVGTTEYVRRDCVDRAVLSSKWSGPAAEELTVQEVCPVYSFAKDPVSGRMGQVSKLALSFVTMPATRIRPGHVVALRVVR